ncbi:glutathione S-transferase-like [Saccostrea echinata]|uniref:glutathione S-transferase-like n=1 Tax=Saccostrea echinata TaxID=191078 RepID=UPI002A80C1B4|nr:glutathione S-transferase-like [Saccostrea echinata]
MPKYKLTYFDLRGRAEPTRLLFTVAGVSFEDERIRKEQWTAIKDKTPGNSLPVLSVDGFLISQSMAINRHLARTFGLDGETLSQKVKVDEIVECLVEMKNKMAELPMLSEDPRKQEWARQILKSFQELMVKACTFIEAQIQKNMKEGKGFAVGNRLTFADIMIFEAFENILATNSNALDKCLGIMKCRAKVANMPRIKEYLSKRQHTNF